jgi:hypothetical protein
MLARVSDLDLHWPPVDLVLRDQDRDPEAMKLAKKMVFFTLCTKRIQAILCFKYLQLILFFLLQIEKRIPVYITKKRKAYRTMYLCANLNFSVLTKPGSGTGSRSGSAIRPIGIHNADASYIL